MKKHVEIKHNALLKKTLENAIDVVVTPFAL
jgi:hypothetical protein